MTYNSAGGVRQPGTRLSSASVGTVFFRAMIGHCWSDVWTGMTVAGLQVESQVPPNQVPTFLFNAHSHVSSFACIIGGNKTFNQNLSGFDWTEVKKNKILRILMGCYNKKCNIWKIEPWLSRFYADALGQHVLFSSVVIYLQGLTF